MTKNIILQEAEKFIIRLFEQKLTADHRFHDLAHTRAVRDACKKMVQKLGVASEEMEVLELAALFHDSGYTATYSGHEVESRRIAEAFLKEQEYPANKLQAVLRCIDVTYPSGHPENLTQQIIKDADYVHLASEDYVGTIESLRHEWEVFLDKSYEDSEWYRLNYDFLKNHQYITPAARELFEPQKEANLKHLKKVIKKDKKAHKPNLLATPSPGISDSRSAQMMFKTALRNHLDLSNLADNKANIMLSVNALIITVAIPMVASYMKTVPYLVYPMASLLACCLTSMIFATLATRPIRMRGYTKQEQIEKGESNLFFFGNFYSMTFKEYQEGMQYVVSNESNLDNSIMRDLFFLGKSLGKKYNQLRICYNIFMFGMVFTVLIFVISYALLK
ncbi:MAG: DUF5706 domain-containing protein [Saprospiraceae bacterium]|nr:DUF5706 domain-containing protein [Saprospiraceae bacterium]